MARRMTTQERTNQILDAAMGVFARQGFDAARMEDIAAASGLSKGSLYLHFRSKDDLIAGLLDRLFADSLSRLGDGDATASPPAAMLAAVFHGMAEEMARLAPILPIWFEFYAVAGRKAAVRERLARYFDQFRDAIATIVNAGIATGEFESVDASQAAVAIIAQLEGTAILWAVDPATIDPATHLNGAARLFLAALARGGTR